MAKRAISAILILLFLLSASVIAVSVLFAPDSPFEDLDNSRAESLLASVGGKAKNEIKSRVLSPEGRYIVQFKQSATLDEIAEALDGYKYNLLAESEARLFTVSVGESGFLEENIDIIEYSEPDLKRESLAVFNDPVKIDAHEPLGLYSAWEKVTVDSQIIIAVLDTGVDRTHEDLLNANILSGYDSVERVSGVDGDEVGHGTGVIGIIAAESDNRLGISGVASGVTILPVKVSSSGTTIYSSDLISGIRFAADAGAKILNMSVGGYSSSYAEQEAVNYAVSKGCILIAAAGNGGRSPYADQKSYPASYDGVISVGSCDYDGKKSDFSQYNDAVDVTAYGENIPMPYVEDGVSVYRTDSGTSFSCAFVSGIAALALTVCGEARFEGEEFLSLIIETCGRNRTDEMGHGIINADLITAIAAEPIVTGAVNGGIYNGRINIGFNRGVATLDDEEFEDGEAVVANGYHRLTVIDGETVKYVIFKLEYDPLTFEFLEFSSFAYFDFERGEAFLDGFPYNARDKITSSGRHSFILSDGNEIVEKTVDLHYGLPTVYGIEDGGVYDRPVDIRIVGDGSAELNGVEVFGETTVSKSGYYCLEVYSGNGALSQEYLFEINFLESGYYEFDYSGATAAIDEENGYMCIYGESLVGVRIYDLASPESFLRFIPVGRVFDHVFYGDELLLFGEEGLIRLDRASLLETEEPVFSTVSPDGMDLFAFNGERVFCFGNGAIHLFNIETESAIPIASLGFECERVLSYGSKLCLISPSNDRIIRIFDCETYEMESYDIGFSFEGVPLCFGGGYLAVGNRLIDIETGETVLEFCSDYAVKISDGLIYSDNRIIEIETGKEIGSFEFLVNDIVITETNRYIFGVEPIMVVVPIEIEGVNGFFAAERTEFGVSATETVNPYRYSAFYDIYSAPLSAAASENALYFLQSYRNLIFSCSIESLEENEPLPLRFSPIEIKALNGYITVCFENAPYIYFAPEEDISAGSYIKTASVCRNAFFNGSELVAVSGGRVITIDPETAQTRVTSLVVDAITPSENNYFILSGGKAVICDLEFNRLAEFNADGENIFIGNGIAVGKEIFDIEMLEITATLEADIIAFSGDTVITENGVFGLNYGEYIGHLGINAPELVVISPDNSVISLGGGIISVCRFGDGTEIVADPEISGVVQDETYIDSATIEFSHGIAFLDGDVFESGSTITRSGNHKLFVALPCGRSVNISFTVAARLSGIEFLSDSRNMSVGETITLGIRYLPEGASSVPVSFYCESEGLLVNADGTITALEVGEYIVTAVSETENGIFTAQCIITVRDDLIAFSPESGITIDRDNGLILGITAGTGKNSLISLVTSGGRPVVSDNNGAKGYIGTGSRVTLYGENGEIADELFAVVVGDIDGDGCITSYDIYELERVLSGYSYSAAHKAAADINGNGVLADRDLRLLKNIVLGRTLTVVGTPVNNLFGTCSVQTVSNIESGEIIDVVLCISGCKYARGVSGVIEYGEGLEFISAESTGWNIGYHDFGSKIGFYSYGNNGEDCEKAFKLLINLKFRVTAEAGKTVTLSSTGFTVSFKDGSRLVKFENSELSVQGADRGEFSIDILNAQSFEFDAESGKYTERILIPYNSALADIHITRREDQTVSVSGLVVGDSDEGIINVSCIDTSGKTEYYTIYVKRDTAPEFDTNCKLAVLEIEGFHLEPSFSPDILEYTVTVPVGTEKINVYCAAQSKSDEIIISDTALEGSETVVTVTVVAPDGETLVYVINVVMKDEEINESSEILIDEPQDDKPEWWVVAIMILVPLAIASVIVGYVHLAKQDEAAKQAAEAESQPENDNSETADTEPPKDNGEDK